MPTTRRQRRLEMEHAVKHWGKEVEEAAGARIRRQERQHQQRNHKEPGAGRKSPQGLRAVARLASGSATSSSEEVWEDAQGEEDRVPVSVLTLKRLFWQEHGVERRSVATQTDPVAIMSAGEVLTGKVGAAEKVLAKEMKFCPPRVNSRPPPPPPPARVEVMPQVEIRVDGRGTRFEERNREEPVISAAAEELALEAGLAELTHESANRGWGRRVESVLGTVYEATVPSFARFWEQDDPFGIISGGAR